MGRSPSMFRLSTSSVANPEREASSAGVFDTRAIELSKCSVMNIESQLFNSASLIVMLR